MLSKIILMTWNLYKIQKETFIQCLQKSYCYTDADRLEGKHEGSTLGIWHYLYFILGSHLIFEIFIKLHIDCVYFYFNVIFLQKSEN